MANGAVIGSLRVALGLDTAQFESGLKQVQSRLGGVGKAFAALGGSAVFAGFITGIGGAVGRLEEMRKLSAQLDRALANTGNAARTSAKEVEEFADRLEKSTGRAAEEVMGIATNLATFGFGHDTFYRAIELANDMAAAWGGDLKQNVEGLGRALAEPEKGLAMLVKRGITFDEQQKAQIAQFMKVNDLAGAQGVIFAALEGQVKGVAEAGFGGLTKASANAWKAVEDFFEAVASGAQVGAVLEVALTSAAGAMNLLTDNLDVVARAAGVAGTALAVALGPTIWGALTTAATVFGASAVGAIRAIGAAIAANPIGAIVTAFAAAVSAVFLFRDEIKAVLGVDLAGVIIEFANKLIGSFVGAFNSIAATWSALPAVLGDVTVSTANAVISGIEGMINGAIRLINDFTDGARGALAAIGIEIGTIGDVEFKALENQWAGAISSLGQTIQSNMNSAMSADYIGGLFSMFTSGTESAVNGFADLDTSITNTVGGASEKMKSALEALRASLMTEEEAELASHQKRLAQIAEFYAARAIQKDEHDRLIERAHEMHAERMLQIEERRAQEEARIRDMTVGGVASVLGSIGKLIEGSGEKNLAAAKAFAVGEAVVNTALGITKALTLPPPASWAQAAAVAASGAAQIATIVSASRGTSSRPAVNGGAGSVDAGGAASAPSRSISINLQGDNFSRESVGSLFQRLNEELGVDGLQIVTTYKQA